MIKKDKDTNNVSNSMSEHYEYAKKVISGWSKWKQIAFQCYQNEDENNVN